MPSFPRAAGSRSDDPALRGDQCSSPNFGSLARPPRPHGRESSCFPPKGRAQPAGPRCPPRRRPAPDRDRPGRRRLPRRGRSPRRPVGGPHASPAEASTGRNSFPLDRHFRGIGLAPPPGHEVGAVLPMDPRRPSCPPRTETFLAWWPREHRRPGWRRGERRSLSRVLRRLRGCLGGHIAPVAGRVRGRRGLGERLTDRHCVHMEAPRTRVARLRRGAGLLFVGSSNLECGLVPEKADVCPSRDLARLTSRHLLGELLELTLLPPTAQRATR